MCSGSKSHIYYAFRFGIPYNHRQRSYFWSCSRISLLNKVYNASAAFVIADHSLVIHSGYPLPDKTMPWTAVGKPNDYTPFGDTGSFGTGERIFCLYQEPLAIKWVQCWSSSLHLLRDKEINSKDTVETLPMKNSLIWMTLDFFCGQFS